MRVRRLPCFSALLFLVIHPGYLRAQNAIEAVVEVESAEVETTEPLFVVQNRSLLSRSTTLGRFTFIEGVSGRNIERTFDPMQPLPMIVFLHGVGDRPIVPAWPYANFRTPARIIMLQGFSPIGTGFQWIRTRVRDHEPVRFAGEVEQAGTEIAEFLREIVRARPTLGKPILVGFSQGGHVTWEVALHHPSSIAAAFPVAAWIPAVRTDDLRPRAYNPPIRCFHGELDNIVPEEPSKALADSLRSRGFDISFSTFAAVEHATSLAMGIQVHAALESALVALQGSWLNLAGAIPIPPPYMSAETPVAHPARRRTPARVRNHARPSN